jgi:hypothetical protein
MAPGGPFDCVTNFSGTCTPDHAFETPGDIHLLAMPIFHLELGPAYLLLLAITSAIYLLMVFGIRLFLRLKVNGPFGKDDWACALSTSFGLVYSVVVVVQVFLGFGATLRHFSPAEKSTMAIIGWANGFCLNLAGYFSKMSACFMLARMTRTREHLAVAYGLMAAMTMWMLQAQISTVFQCKYPRPWDTSPHNVCYDRVCCLFLRSANGKILTLHSGAIGSPLPSHPGYWNSPCSLARSTWYETKKCNPSGILRCCADLKPSLNRCGTSICR